MLYVYIYVPQTAVTMVIKLKIEEFTTYKCVQGSMENKVGPILLLSDSLGIKYGDKILIPIPIPIYVAIW